MKLPFTVEQFFQVIENYNKAVFPAQLVILLAGIITISLLFKNTANKSKWISGIIGGIWIWIGIVYHIIFFTSINPAAFVFGALFIAEGLLVLRCAFLKRNLNFILTKSIAAYTGFFLILYGLIFYPVVSYLVESSFSKTIALGLPCPSTILTFGFFILAARQFPKHLLIIPIIWAIIGVSAAINIGVVQDLMIIVAAIAATIIIYTVKKESKPVKATSEIMEKQESH